MELQIRNQFLYQGIETPSQILELLTDLSKPKFFLILDKNVKNIFLDNLIDELKTSSMLEGIYHHDGREPSTDLVDEVRHKVKSASVDSIMGIGGGSTLDLMKAISVLHYLNQTAAEAQGATLEIKQKLFSLALPTTAGSGSESTKSAVLTNLTTKIKRGVNHLRVIPDVAILVPGLLEGIPDKVFVASVFDGLTHSLESIIGRSGSKKIKDTARSALKIFLRQMEKLNQNEKIEMDPQILEGSYLAGVAICNSETGPVHAISYPLSEHCNFGHGEAVGYLLPKVLKVYIEEDLAMREKLGDELGMPLDDFISMIEDVYLMHILRLDNKYIVENISMLAARSLQLQGAIMNCPLPWTRELSERVLAQCLESGN